MEDRTNEMLTDHLTSTKGQSVTKAGIEAIIAGTEYQRLTPTLTVCMLTLANGFVVLGQSACVDPANYDQEIGERIAYEDAFDKIWPLEGYLLATRLMLLKDQGASERIASLDNELQPAPAADPDNAPPPGEATPIPEQEEAPPAPEAAAAEEEAPPPAPEEAAAPEQALEPGLAADASAAVSRETASDQELPPRDAAPAREPPQTHRQEFDDAAALDATEGGTAHVDAFWSAYDGAAEPAA